MAVDREIKQRLAKIYDVAESEITPEMMPPLPPDEGDWLSLLTSETEFGG